MRSILPSHQLGNFAAILVVLNAACSPNTTAAPASANNTYYTAPTGLDANSGTLSAPFKTIAKGVSVLKPGDILYIRAGTYDEAIDNEVPSGTSWANPVTLAAYPGETVTIQPTDSRVVLISSPVSYIIFQDLILDGSNLTTAYPVVYINNMYGTGTPHHLRFIGGEIRNSDSSQGVLIESSTSGATPDYNEFINIKIHDNGATNLHHGIYIQSSHNLVSGCDIYHNATFAIQIYRDNAVNGVNASYNIVRNNKLHDNAVSGGGAGAVLSGGDGNIAYNNLIWNNRGGILVDYSASNTGVYDNTIYANNANGATAPGIQLGYNVGASNTTIRDNIIFGNTAGDIITQSATNTVADHNTLGATDPKFVNASGFDFHLQAGSPAIGAGVAVPGITTDFDGATRPQGSSYDTGAYEYVP